MAFCLNDNVGMLKIRCQMPSLEEEEVLSESPMNMR